MAEQVIWLYTALLSGFTRATLASAGINCRRASVRLSVCPSVRLSQVGVLLKRLNVGSCEQRHTIAQGLSFNGAENLGETQTRSPPTEASNAGGVR